jgi:hypothetical protein
MGNTGLDTIDLTNKAAQAAIEVTERVIDAIILLLESEQSKKMYKTINDYISNGGKADIYTPQDFPINEIEKRMKEKNIPYAIGYEKTTGNMVIVTRNSKEDRDLMQKIQTSLYVEQKRVTRLSPKEFYNLNKNKPTYTIDNLTPHQVSLFQEAAKKSNFAFTAVKNDVDGNYKVYVNENDVAKANSALISVAMKSAGINGKINKDQHTQVAGTVDLANEMSHVINRDFYVVSARSPEKCLEYIHVNSDGFTRVRNNKTLETKKEKESFGFEKEIHARFNEIIDPVILTADEFALEESERNKLIQSKFSKPHLSAEQADQYDVEVKTINALIENFEKTQSDTIDVKEILSTFDDEADKAAAMTFINDVVEQKKSLDIIFAENIEKELGSNDIDKDFEVDDITPNFTEVKSRDR